VRKRRSSVGTGPTRARPYYQQYAARLVYPAAWWRPM
jgi:hypothetical protein